MRRSSEGVQNVAAMIADQIGRVEAFDPEWLIGVLEPFALDPRRDRVLEVLGRRLDSVAVLFDSPYDPHNGAAVLRSCEAFGVQNLHVVERGRTRFVAAASVTRGTSKWVDLSLHGEPAPAIATLKTAGYELVAAHPDGELEPEDLAAIPRVALVIGNERDGINPEIEAACARRVRVPMRGFVESLNVSVTLAILLHAATRGRPGDLGEAQRRRLYARGLYFSVNRADEILDVALAARG